jgi:YVTN family beta-propeller protein
MGTADTRGRGARALLPLSLGMAALLTVGPMAAGAATVSAAWSAKIGSAGVNGTATISAFTTGTGTLALKLAKLKASTLLPVVLYKGTCGSVGAVLLTLAPIKTTSSGAASRTSSLTAAQATKITAAATAGKIAIRIGTGTARKCGAFSQMAIPAYVAATINLPDYPSGVAVAPNGVWVTNWGDLAVSRVDPATNTVIQTVTVGTETFTDPVLDEMVPQAIAYGEGSLWVTLVGIHYDPSANPPIQWTAGAVVRLDPATGTVKATIPVGRGPIDIEVTAGAVWVPLAYDGMIVRIDPATNGSVTSVPVPDPTGVAIGLGAVWVACYCGTVSRIDPATNAVVTSINTQTTGDGIAIGGGSVWATHFGHEGQADGSVSRINPAANAVVANVVVGEDAGSIAFAGGSVWVGLRGAPTVVQIGGPGYSVAKKITVSASVQAIAATDHSVWAVEQAAEGAGKVTRINY